MRLNRAAAPLRHAAHPICVAMPVHATMPTAWPLLMVVPAKTMHSCA
jgi:hypothetical protein